MGSRCSYQFFSACVGISMEFIAEAFAGGPLRVMGQGVCPVKIKLYKFHYFRRLHMKTLMRFTLTSMPLIILLGGCYVLPMDQYGNPIYPRPPAMDGQFVTPSATVIPSTTVPAGSSKRSGPITISARLYPDSELAAETGVISGSVTNMLTGKGRFNLSYKGEAYSGEATRVSNDSRRGVASAFSPKGGYMSCEYQMNTPRQGAGTCLFSNGAKYKLHLGD